MDSTPTSVRTLSDSFSVKNTCPSCLPYVPLSSPPTHAHPSAATIHALAHSDSALQPTFDPPLSHIGPSAAVNTPSASLVHIEHKHETHPDLSRARTTEVDEIIRKLGYPQSIVQLVMNNSVTTREDLLDALRKEVHRIKLCLGLEARAEEEDEIIAAKDVVEGLHELTVTTTKTKKAKVKMGPGWDDGEMARPSSPTTHFAVRKGTRSIAPLDLSRRPSQRRPAVLDLRQAETQELGSE